MPKPHNATQDFSVQVCHPGRNSDFTSSNALHPCGQLQQGTSNFLFRWYPQNGILNKNFHPMHPLQSSSWALSVSAHVLVLMYLEYIFLYLLWSLHDDSGVHAAPSQQGYLWRLTGHVNGLSLDPKWPWGAVGPRGDDGLAPHWREEDRAAARCGLESDAVVVSYGYWVITKQRISKWGPQVIKGPLRTTVGPKT